MLKFEEETSFRVRMKVSVGNITIIEEVVEDGDSIYMGYSSQSNKIEKDKCDSVQLCNTSAEKSTSKRYMLNELTKYSGIEMIQHNASYQYKAICTWLEYVDNYNDNNLINAPILDHFTRYSLIS